MNKKDLKRAVGEEINKMQEALVELGNKLYQCPELGYKEVKTASIMKEEFAKIGVNTDIKVAHTGFKGKLAGGLKGPRIAVLGELDSVQCRKHPHADKNTGAVHACGHFVQLVSLLGVAAGLKNSGAMENLAGEVVFMTVPAEEFIDLEYRERLVEEGAIKYKSGKQQAIWEGHFDDIDIALMHHVLPNDYPYKAYAGMTSNTFISKEVTFIGKEAHAGAAPHLGANALNMAMLALNNINSQRETFYEDDKVRVHSIIKKCGDAVNVIPGEVEMETVVRGASQSALQSAAAKVDRCLFAGAYAVGGDLIIKNTAGYLPLVNNDELMNLYVENMGELIGEENVTKLGSITASFDFGDITHLIPGLHSFVSAAKGSLHSKEFELVDHKLVYIDSTKALAYTIIDLLYEKGQLAKNIINNHQPLMTKEKYFNYLEENSKTLKGKPD